MKNLLFILFVSFNISLSAGQKPQQDIRLRPARYSNYLSSRANALKKSQALLEKKLQFTNQRQQNFIKKLQEIKQGPARAQLQNIINHNNVIIGNFAQEISALNNSISSLNQEINNVNRNAIAVKDIKGENILINKAANLYNQETYNKQAQALGTLRNLSQREKILSNQAKGQAGKNITRKGKNIIKRIRQNITIRDKSAASRSIRPLNVRK